MTPPTLHILTTCTKRKTAEPPPELCLRRVRGADAAARAAEWLRRVEAAAGRPTVAAEHLYCGDHWTIARSLVPAAVRAGFDARLWVLSTGYGLIPGDAPIVPYSATFSPSHKDTVGTDAAAFGAWWAAMAEWRGPVRGPRTVADLVREDPAAGILVVASERYLSAVAADLAAAADRMADRDRLVIVSGGTRRLGGLTPNLLPVDARMQAVLGGARRTLNVRMAKRVLGEATPAAFAAPALAAKYRRVLDAQPPAKVFHRRKATDADVTRFVARALAKDPAGTATRLLRRFRDDGWACEQWRFKRLFDAAAAEARRTQAATVVAAVAAGGKAKKRQIPRRVDVGQIPLFATADGKRGGRR